MHKTLRISGLLSALLMAWGVEAAGLGKLSVYSSLGQPLKAEIELVAVQKDELGAVSAKLANAEAFRQARIDRAEALSGLRFNVDQRPNGQPVLKISSSTPVNDPFLDMLIELNWSSGRLIREYSILLDPPADLRAKAEPPAAQPAPQPPAVAAPAEKPAAKPVAPAEVAKPKPEAQAAPAETKQYGPIKPGETLHAIAAKTKPGDVSLEQMMVGLYHQNKSAFAGNNMNRLKKGAVLNLPDRDAAMMVDHARAAREVRMQAADWHAYRQRLAAAAETRPAEPATEAAAGKVVPKAEEKAAPPTAAAKDVLKLSKGEPGAAKADAKAQEKVQALEEELAAKSRALKESQDRVTQLERTVKDMQRLLELKEAAKPTPAPAATPQPEPAPTPQVAAPVEPAPAPSSPPPVVKAEPPALPAPIPVPTEGPSWLTTFISSPIYIGGIVAAVLLSFLLWMMMVGTRRRRGLTNFEDSIMTGGEFKNEAVFTAGTGAAGAPTGGSALMTDFSRLGLGAIDAHEVDPIAEAEVYMAYGRDAQAEEILKEALAKDPTRHEITLKLLEIYASRKDTVAFETQASELYASLGGQPTEVWMKAAEMGKGIDPDNPLYRITPGAAGYTAAAAAAVATAAVAAQAAEPSHEEVSDLSAMGVPAEPEVVEPETPAATEEELLDFESAFAMPEAGPSVEEVPAVEELVFDEVNVPSEEAEAPAAFAEQPALAEEPEAVEFELGAELPGSAPEPVPEEPALAGPAEIEFEVQEMGMPEAAPIELPEEAMAETVAEEIPSQAVSSAELPDLDFGGIDLELKEAVAEEPALPVIGPGAEAVEEAAAEPSMEIDPEVWEETNTKLDLARAYLEMGDHEGAREILQEVMNDGDSKQRDEAGKLLSTAA